MDISTRITHTKTIEKIFYYLVLCMLLGRAIFFTFHDSPVRVILWNQELLSGFLQTFFNMNWEEYASDYAGLTSKNGDRFFAFSYWICFLSIIYAKWKRKSLIKFSLFYAFLITLAYSSLYFLLKQKKAGIILELSVQTITPLLYLFHLNNVKENILKSILSLSIAFTFLGHGLFAWGYYPVPGHFIDMTIGVFSFLNETNARLFLKIAAILDLIIAIASLGYIAIRFKSNIFFNAILWYAVFWGFVTAIARYTSYLSWWIDFWGWQSFIPQILFRVPHWGFPLLLILLIKKSLLNEKA